ncbi:S-adenosyl-L-methionine-dependent methyltransferase [Decorospora gaudefroyi]|uniref:S-adenosyl-L-methionine-dependent methyltransferase n=1 Tax=Decorospora gaudefroyi TaxID=184978 RepID=A0A6A5K6J5_9PLEO|nr:S-adenosyl-L-methionine-dependent methyltransferase [Decorospora gaudefroyi]
MTQPTSIDMTFDTSLVDLHPPTNANTSFSTTESDPKSDQSQITSAPAIQPTKPSAPTPVQHIPTQVAYDQWASVYDNDGNMLQATDDIELGTRLPEFLSRISSTSPHVSVLDLGCGTGRNTARLLSYDWPRDQRVSITGLDFSTRMLQVAATKLSSLAKEKKSRVELRLDSCDCFPPTSSPAASPLPALSPPLQPVHAVISTLVLEHVPIIHFFCTLHALLIPGGLALVTNMHADMGRVSQAGFVNDQGVKVRGQSYVYTVEETLDAARAAGFDVLGVCEREMRREDVESGRVGERGGKWVGVKVWYAVELRRSV